MPGSTDENKTNHRCGCSCIAWSEPVFCSQQTCTPNSRRAADVRAAAGCSNSPRGKAQGASSNEKILIPAGTRIGVVLENGISTRSAKRATRCTCKRRFPITQNNRIVIPVGSYFAENHRFQAAGKDQGEGRIRLRLNTLILPTVTPVESERGATQRGFGGKETWIPKERSPARVEKGKTPVRSRDNAAGAGIGAIASRTAKGAGIGAVSARRRDSLRYCCRAAPKRKLPRGSTMDIVLERELSLDASQIQFTNLGHAPGVVQTRWSAE